MSLEDDVRLGHRLAQASMDLEEAHNYVRLAAGLPMSRSRTIQSDAEFTQQALVTAAIILYARPFVGSRSNNLSAKYIDPAAVDLFKDAPHHREFHARVMELRHEAVAHADWKQHSTWLIGRTGTNQIERSHAQTAYRFISLKKFLALVEFVRQRIGMLAYQVDDRTLSAIESLPEGERARYLHARKSDEDWARPDFWSA